MPWRTSDSSTPAYSGPCDAKYHGVRQWAISCSSTISLRAHFGICSTPLASAVARRWPKPGRTSNTLSGQRTVNQSRATRPSTYACILSTVGSRRPRSSSNSAR